MTTSTSSNLRYLDRAKGVTLWSCACQDDYTCVPHTQISQLIHEAVEAQREVDAQISIAMGKRAQSMRKHGALLGAMLSISESIAEAIQRGKA